MKKPTALDWHLYGGGLLVATGASATYPPAGLMVFGGWVCFLGILYVKERGKKGEK